MKLTILTLTALGLMASCQSGKQETNEQAATDSLSVQSSTTTVGADRDEHGCIGSAGYTWSPVKKECIRIFEQIKMLPTTGTDTTRAAYLLFNTDRTQAELFMPGQAQSIVLDRTGEEGNYSWKNDSLEMSAWKGFILKNKGKLIYHGDELK